MGDILMDENALFVLAVDSNYEPATNAGFLYREASVYPYLEKQGLRVVRCQGKMARRYIVEDEIKKSHISFLTGVGHGLDDVFTGDHEDPIFAVGVYNPSEVKSKIVHFLSCQTAKALGPDFVVSGCLAYFGYDINFTFSLDEPNIFFECDSEIDYAIADRCAADEVYRRVYALMTKRIGELDAAGRTYTASILETNRDHLCAPSLHSRWGSITARLT
jgi:hypothetical protein